MTADPANRLNRAAILAAKSAGDTELLENVVIGRDVLELVSSAMYIDPMTVYREYVQNAADAIDDARASGLLEAKELGKVNIAIDPASRSIRIRDNGTGVANSEFGRKMVALGASGKRGTSARGFRGVGRLAGLGYAQELVFRSRTSSDKAVFELTWDCRKLKTLLRQGDGEIEDLIRAVATLRKRPAQDYPEHFFEVELRGVVRLRSDRLMSPPAVHDYLAQVAPVPFAPEFTFGAEIRAALLDAVDLGELEIQIEGELGPVYRPHRDVIQDLNGRTIEGKDLSVSQISGINGELAAVAWILHHNYEGALPNGAGVKGLRLRSGNIQIGDHALLEELFPESRFNAWAIGEIHVLDRKIVPNGRRDHFEQNAHYHNLTNQLAPIAREISRLCRTSSIKRKWTRDVELQLQSINQLIDVIAQGTISDEERVRYRTRANDGIVRIEKALSSGVLDEKDIAETSIALNELRNRLEALSTDVVSPTELQRLDQREREVFKRFCDLVYQCSSSTVVAKSLVDRILKQL
jgi:molecular chaperone HtpG